MNKGLLLISGGFDSAVAGYIMQKQGMEVIALHYSYFPLTDNAPEEKSRKAAEKLKFKKLITINIAEECQEIKKKCNHRFYFILTKRLMIKKAEEIAKKEGCDFIITGESLVINEVYYLVDSDHGLDSAKDRGINLNIIAQNINTGAGSTNIVKVTVKDICRILQRNNLQVANNININTNTGGNSASGNTGAGSVITGVKRWGISL